jgi:hypothetical protein
LEEGSPAAPMIRAVNFIADAIKEEFPAVAIDTLAYLLRVQKTDAA